MTTAHITRHQAPAPRDLLTYPLFCKMQWCERHPVLMLGGALITGLIGATVIKVWL